MNDAALVYVGLGSNLDDPRRQLLDAMDELDRLPGTRLRRRSSLYRSAPMGRQDQPDFINAVAEIETGLQPEPLLDALQGIEAAHGRVRERRWGPRTLDLDIRIYKNEQIRTERPVVPHPCGPPCRPSGRRTAASARAAGGRERWISTYLDIRTSSYGPSGWWCRTRACRGGPSFCILWPSLRPGCRCRARGGSAPCWRRPMNPPYGWKKTQGREGGEGR